jgi:hypothetical protein
MEINKSKFKHKTPAQILFDHRTRQTAVPQRSTELLASTYPCFEGIFQSWFARLFAFSLFPFRLENGQNRELPVASLGLIQPQCIPTCGWFPARCGSSADLGNYQFHSLCAFFFHFLHTVFIVLVSFLSTDTEIDWVAYMQEVGGFLSGFFFNE